MDQHSYITLRVTAPDKDASEHLSWIGLAANGEVVASGSDLPEHLPTCRELEIVLPAPRVSAQWITLPQASGRFAGQILAQSLEDRLLDKPEAVHYVQGPRSGENVLVWVVARDWLASTLSRFAAMGKKPLRAVVEYEFLPEDSGLVCAAGNNYVFFRDAAGRYGCVDSNETLAILYPEQEITQVSMPLYSISTPDKTNLLTGPFAPGSASGLKLIDFRRSFFLAGGLLVLLLLQLVLQWQSLAKHEAKLQQEIRQAFAAAYPGTPIVDPILQWQSKQTTGSSANDNKDALNLASWIASNMQTRLHPRSLDVRDGVLRLVLPESDSAAARTALEKISQPYELSPVDAGTVRLVIRPKR